MSKDLGIVVGLLMSANVWAQLPHEVLLLVNKQSQPSLKVANTYAAARQIPQRNIVYLDIPDSLYGGTASITPEQFAQRIWEPANAVAKERGIDGQILAWVYSVDFPIRVITDANDRRQMSLMGLTFMRNQIPGLSLVEEGKYLSRLFAGPNERLTRSLPSLSFRKYRDGVGESVQVPDDVQYLRDGLKGQMPLPSMMLGYIGENGNDVETVLGTIQRGLRSDYRGVHGGIHFVMTDDVRSKCREWQYYPAVNELKDRGITATVTTNFPAGEKYVMGLLMGAETVDPSAIKSFAPGAMAEHLTSWSAEFQRPQTKLTEWLKAGATGTAGSVVEPYSNPNKFPSARFYTHYVSGCTMLESFYQSIACPLQTLLLGDPMARPYAPIISAKLLGLDSIKDDFTYVAMVESRLTNVEYLYSFLMDGKEIRRLSDEASVWIPIASLSDGYHELRLVVRPKHMVEFGISVDRAITVIQSGHSIAINMGDIVKTGTNTHRIKVQIGGTPAPQAVRLVCGEMVLDEKEYSEDVALELNELLIGEGPSRIQAVAVYADGRTVASPPLGITITFAP